MPAHTYTHAHKFKFSGIRPQSCNTLSTGKFATSANGANMVDGCNKARLRAERIEPSMLGNPPSSGRYLGAFRPEPALGWGARGWNLWRMRAPSARWPSCAQGEGPLLYLVAEATKRLLSSSRRAATPTTRSWSAGKYGSRIHGKEPCARP